MCRGQSTPCVMSTAKHAYLNTSAVRSVYAQSADLGIHVSPRAYTDLGKPRRTRTTDWLVISKKSTKTTLQTYIHMHTPTHLTSHFPGLAPELFKNIFGNCWVNICRPGSPVRSLRSFTNRAKAQKANISMCFITLSANEAAMKQNIAISPVCLSVCLCKYY